MRKLFAKEFDGLSEAVLDDFLSGYSVDRWIILRNKQTGLEEKSRLVLLSWEGSIQTTEHAVPLVLTAPDKCFINHDVTLISKQKISEDLLFSLDADTYCLVKIVAEKVDKETFTRYASEYFKAEENGESKPVLPESTPKTLVDVWVNENGPVGRFVSFEADKLQLEWYDEKSDTFRLRAFVFTDDYEIRAEDFKENQFLKLLLVDDATDLCYSIMAPRVDEVQQFEITLEKKFLKIMDFNSELKKGMGDDYPL